MGKENREGREGWMVEWEREQEGKETNTLSCAARGKCLGTRLVGRGEWEGGVGGGMRRVGRRGERGQKKGGEEEERGRGVTCITCTLTFLPVLLSILLESFCTPYESDTVHK